MGFILDAATGAYEVTRERMRQGVDFDGYRNIRPQIDQKERKEFLAEQRDGRTADQYKQCLEFHGFVWWPADALPALEGDVKRIEGEWRHQKMKLAFTPNDLAGSFPGGPESLDRYLKDFKLANAVTKRRAPKSELRKFRDRR